MTGNDGVLTSLMGGGYKNIYFSHSGLCRLVNVAFLYMSFGLMWLVGVASRLPPLHANS